MGNTELNDLRKTISLRKSEVYVKKKTVSNVTEKLMEHCIHLSATLIYK